MSFVLCLVALAKRDPKDGTMARRIVRTNAKRDAPHRGVNSHDGLTIIRIRCAALMAEIKARRPLIADELLSAIIEEFCPSRTRPPDELRDSWIYAQCVAGVPYSRIIKELDRMPHTWGRIKTVQGIKNRAAAHARRYHLPLPPARRGGRPREIK